MRTAPTQNDLFDRVAAARARVTLVTVRLELTQVRPKFTVDGPVIVQSSPLRVDAGRENRADRFSEFCRLVLSQPFGGRARVYPAGP